MLTAAQTWTFILSLLALIWAAWAVRSGAVDRFLGTGTKRPRWDETFEHLVTPPRGQVSCPACCYFCPVDDLTEGLCPDCHDVVLLVRDIDARIQGHPAASAGRWVISYMDHTVAHDEHYARCSCGWEDNGDDIDDMFDKVDAHFENPQEASDLEWGHIQRAIDDEARDK